MLVTIESCANGFVITNELTGQVFVATRIESYTMANATIVSVLNSIEAAETAQAKPNINDTDAADIV